MGSVLQQVKKGTLVPAVFQRGYAWFEADVLAFFESILRGYPVGSLLLWTPPAEVKLQDVAKSRLGPIQRDEGLEPASLLLDGQHRLSTMAWLMFDPSQPYPTDLSAAELSIWSPERRLVVDIEQQRLAFVPADEADSGFRLPAHVLVDSRAINQYMRERWDTLWAGISADAKDEGFKWLDTCTDAFREVRVTLTDIQGATVEEAKDAFLHICKVGVPMSTQDLDATVSWVGSHNR